jgi:hypothetical protein
MKLYIFIASIISIFWFGVMITRYFEYFRKHKKNKYSLIFSAFGAFCLIISLAINYFN